jgi:hypothetical protein
MMSSAVAFQMKGLGSSFQAVAQAVIASVRPRYFTDRPLTIRDHRPDTF